MATPDHLVELSGVGLASAGASAFAQLQAGRILVIRNLPEIHELGRTACDVAAGFGAPAAGQRMSELMHSPEAAELETLAVFYRTLRRLRDSRYLSCLFSDLISRLGAPASVLVDSGFFRMFVPRLYEAARARPDLFDAAEFGPQDPNEAEHALQGGGWGNAHRDLDSRHYHFQLNFWFPLHDVDEKQTLLLFPDAYRRDLPQYGELPGPEDPSRWGLGPVLQVPLRFGDLLMFHSQHLHASPSQAANKNRFTVEIRTAAGCIDDNARIYRRLFWNLGNFLPARADAADSAGRARQLALPDPGMTGVEFALSGATAHTVVHRLFRRPEGSLAAGYLHRPDDVLNDAIPLTADEWRRLTERLTEFSCGEDLWLLVARLLLLQKQPHLAASVLERVIGGSRSYFWALEAGRIAAEAGDYNVAERAFSAADAYAVNSDVALDRYGANMPPPRNPVELQLLAPTARLAAARFFRLVGRLRSDPSTRVAPAAFDHRYFWDPSFFWRPSTESGRALRERLKRLLGRPAISAIAKAFRLLRHH